MELDDATRDELAGFFARRFPTAESRDELARTAGFIPDTVEGPGTALTEWIALLDQAHRTGALARLADAACAAAPDDKNLAEARALLRGPPVRPAGGGGRTVALVAVGLVVALIGAGALGASWMSGGEADAVPAPPLPGAPVEVAPLPVETAPAIDVAPLTEPPVPAPVEVAPPVEPPAPIAALAPPDPVQEINPARNRSPSCKAASGVMVGWWYAGTSSPGGLGETISLPTSVNVRDDYPRRENGYALKGRVLCWLPIGTRQRLSHAPVDIGQGHWWVPLAGGDL